MGAGGTARSPVRFICQSFGLCPLGVARIFLLCFFRRPEPSAHQGAVAVNTWHAWLISLTRGVLAVSGRQRVVSGVARLPVADIFCLNRANSSSRIASYTPPTHDRRGVFLHVVFDDPFVVSRFVCQVCALYSMDRRPIPSPASPPD